MTEPDDERRADDDEQRAKLAFLLVLFVVAAIGAGLAIGWLVAAIEKTGR